MIDSKKINRIQLLKNNLPVGELVRTKSGCEINLADEFITSNTSKKLTYHISSESKTQDFKGVGLPPYFAGLLPEGLRLKAIVQKLKTSEDDLFSLLVASGVDPVGDLHFAIPKEQNQESSISDIPESFDDIKANLKSGQDLDSKPLAGVQDKVSADRISLPLSIKKKNKSYILKLASQEFPDIVRNEMTCLQIAKACGLNVNQAKIVTDSHQVEALLVERFDREWLSESKKWDRFHQEDACQFLDRYPADKYRISFQEIAEGVVEFATSPEIEILNLLKLKAFSYLIGNGDLHAKNISLLQKGEQSAHQLSPFYDIICTALYGDQKMAIFFDGKNQNLKRKNFIEFGKRYDLPEEAVVSMLNKLVKLFEKNSSHFFTFPKAIEKEKFLKQFFKERIDHLS